MRHEANIETLTVTEEFQRNHAALRQASNSVSLNIREVTDALILALVRRHEEYPDDLLGYSDTKVDSRYMMEGQYYTQIAEGKVFNSPDMTFAITEYADEIIDPNEPDEPLTPDQWQQSTSVLGIFRPRELSIINRWVGMVMNELDFLPYRAERKKGMFFLYFIGGCVHFKLMINLSQIALVSYGKEDLVIH